MPPSASASASVRGRTEFTPREIEVLELLRLGLSNKVVAARLGIGLDTARRYSSRIKRKANILSAVALTCVDIAHEPDWLDHLDLNSLHLSGAERRVLRLLCRGYSSKHIARELAVSPRTVDKHREHLLRKCSLRSTRQLAAWLASQYVKCGMAN
nr:helix-turn-helix transcriptional regulator [Burkholderia sp. M701]